MGWVLDPAHGDHVERKSHSVTLTCAACHIGRVHVGEGRYQVLVGAPNTQIDVHKFRRAAELTAERLLASDAALDRTVERLIALIKSKPDGYFFRGKYGIDSQAEARADPVPGHVVHEGLAGRLRQAGEGGAGRGREAAHDQLLQAQRPAAGRRQPRAVRRQRRPDSQAPPGSRSSFRRPAATRSTDTSRPTTRRSPSRTPQSPTT